MYRSFRGFVVASFLAIGITSTPVSARADDPEPPAGKPAPERNQPWRAFGKVTDKDGKPLAGIEVSASCGFGTLFRTGSATSGNDGRYELNFGPGIHMSGGSNFQVATIGAHKAGHFEANLNRQGNCYAAMKALTADESKHWNIEAARIVLPDRPVELNFVMRPAGRVSGKLVDEQGQPLAKYGISLNGAEIPPSSSVVCSTYADDQGRFTLENIPATFRYQLEVRKANPKPPWDDMWASAALRFEKPDKGDLHAWFGDREIRLQELVLRVAGPGMHGRTATPMAGTAGVLDLTADPPNVIERKDKLISAKSATLTLRNTPKPDVSQSLIAESAPAESAIASKIRLARSRPNEAGEFTISFENPRGMDLAKGKHQAIVQVTVGEPNSPERTTTLHQLDIRDGRYHLPVKLEPKHVSECQVSVTFVTIQPDHDTWVKSHFKDGKGTGYSGIWLGENAVLAAVRLVN